jgi:hypothetical protein
VRLIIEAEYVSGDEAEISVIAMIIEYCFLRNTFNLSNTGFDYREIKASIR